MEDKSKTGNKINFLLGFFAGLALISMVGFFVLLGVMFTNGEKVDMAAQAEADAGQTAQAPNPEYETVPPLNDNDHVLGDPNAPIQFIIYDDFECPYCLQHEETLKKIRENYADNVVFVYRHFPLSFHENAQKAAEASECAAEQGKFWEMHDLLFESAGEGNLSVEQLKSLAKQLGLNTTEFNDCLDSGEYTNKVQAQLAEGASVGVQGTPGNFLNGNLVSGALPYEQFELIFDQLLSQ